MKFGVIVSDPAWAFSDRLQKMKAPTKRSAASQYKTMSAVEIAALDVGDLADPMGCLLALWVPSTLLVDGLSVMSAWGFKYKTTFCWVKQTPRGKLGFGMGRLFRASHEIALIGTSGKSVYPKLKNMSQRSVLFSPNVGHSTKPEGLQDSLDLMFPGEVAKLEMFARRLRPGWTCVGDAVTGQDIAASVQQLKSV